MFVESDEPVWLYGLEHQGGRPRELKAELADQQHFIDFVRFALDLTGECGQKRKLLLRTIDQIITLLDLNVVYQVKTKGTRKCRGLI